MGRRIHKQAAILQVKAFLRALMERLMVKFGPTGVEVDVNDDSLDRWHVTHYRYDPGYHMRTREQRARNGGIGSNISWYEPKKGE